MERKTPFITSEFYHVYSRGIEKRTIFLDDNDYKRFLALLYTANSDRSIHLSRFLDKKEHSVENVYDIDREPTLTSLLCHLEMPNHFHLLVREDRDGGISKFMSKLLTAYSMYFNTKYQRSGSLFVRPFRSVHIKTQSQLIHIFNYIHLNCVDLIEPRWREEGIKDEKAVRKFLETYRYSSLPDYSKKGNQRIMSNIIDMEILPDYAFSSPLDEIEFHSRTPLESVGVRTPLEGFGG